LHEFRHIAVSAINAAIKLAFARPEVKAKKSAIKTEF
jgi:hypothetical protein